MIPPPPESTLFPYTTLFRSREPRHRHPPACRGDRRHPRGDRRGRSEQLASVQRPRRPDRKSTRLNSSHVSISYAVFCLKKKKKNLNELNKHKNFIYEVIFIR